MKKYFFVMRNPAVIHKLNILDKVVTKGEQVPVNLEINGTKIAAMDCNEFVGYAASATCFVNGVLDDVQYYLKKGIEIQTSENLFSLGLANNIDRVSAKVVGMTPSYNWLVELIIPDKTVKESLEAMSDDQLLKFLKVLKEYRDGDSVTDKEFQDWMDDASKVHANWDINQAEDIFLQEASNRFGFLVQLLMKRRPGDFIK